MKALIAMGLCSLLFVGSARAAPRPEWAPREFPISFWCAPPPDFTTPERYREIAAAGFTYVMPPCDGPATSERNHRILDAARAAGLKVFVQDERMPLAVAGTPDATKRLDAIVADYSRHPALAGYFLTDEPAAGAFPGLAEVVAYLRKKDPRHPSYINLLPNYATNEQLGTAGYAQYLRQFAATVKPFVLSYDFYGLLKNGERPGFYANLNAAQRAAADAGIPFWQIVLSVPHGPYRSPNEAEKRWEALQSLAYGAKGVMFFTYWQPGEDPTWHFGPAIVDRQGKPTPQYDEVKRVNADVQAFGRYLLDARLLTAFQTGAGADEGSPREPNTPVALAGQAPITVGLFRANPYVYAFVTNRSYSARAVDDVALSTGGHALERLDRQTGRWMAPKGERTPEGDVKVHVDLAPGDAELYRW